ncbi:hypothetical protein J2752_000002 [Halarchaeum rubridurum]|nr:hypothetical protein [Halarchaeum rubridurum]MBP1953121.1 hypothetical protein [Halarchaeum rubridurum]
MSGSFDVSRRQALSGIGALVVAGGVGYTAFDDGGSWRVAETPVDVSLHDVVATADGRYAVGDGGVIVTRGEQGWETVRETGVTGDGRDLAAASVTEDGGRLWVAGASGVVGEYDVATDTMTSHAAPNDDTDDYRALAVTGVADEANVYVADAAGHVHYSFGDGATGTWDAVTPGSGASLPALDCYGPRAGHAVDTNGTVFATADGETWSNIGVEDANVDFYGIDGGAADDVDVVGGNGTVRRYDGRTWSRRDLGDATLRDVERTERGVVAVGDGGVVFHGGGGSWSADDTPTGATLRAVAVGDPTVAVGDGGVVLERTR